jgi:hypothetical protein
MDSGLRLRSIRVITHGREGAANGEFSFPEEKGRLSAMSTSLRTNTKDNTIQYMRSYGLNL